MVGTWAVALGVATVLPRLMPAGVCFGEHRDDEIVVVLRDQLAHARALACRTRDEPLHDRAILLDGRADLLADLLARAEGAAHRVDRRRRLGRELERRIVGVRRPLAHLQPAQAGHGRGVGRIEHEHRSVASRELGPEGSDAEIASALQLEPVAARDGLPEEVEAVARDGHAGQQRRPHAVLEQQLLAAGARPGAARHEVRHRRQLSLARPSLDEIGIGGVEAEEDDGSGAAVSWHVRGAKS